MVLQQQAEVPLWGKATANHTVMIITSWDHKNYTARSDGAGAWRVAIQTPEAGGPYKITFDDGSRLVLTNILIGEVWVCSGQSNMGMPMTGFPDLPVLNSNKILLHARDAQLRLFQVQRKVSNTPLNDCKGAWELSSSRSAAAFSAVGFQFAQKLQQLLKVPVGIIEADWGGSPIRAWMDKKSIRAFPQFKILPKEKPNKNHATCLFNGMINPIAGYGIKGFIWYQGEADRRYAYLYKDLMAAMVKEWRALWGRGDLPFYYVQIAPFGYRGELKDSVPLIREAQSLAMEIIPSSGMVVTMDAGKKNNLHPPDKTTVARRLLYWALGDTYHWKGIAYKSPSFESMQINDSAVTVSFSGAPMGLTSFDKKINGFELAGKDKVFYPAEAVVAKGGKVILHSDRVPRPVAARYLFKAWATAGIYNTAGLPAAPFRTDDW